MQNTNHLELYRLLSAKGITLRQYDEVVMSYDVYRKPTILEAIRAENNRMGGTCVTISVNIIDTSPAAMIVIVKGPGWEHKTYGNNDYTLWRSVAAVLKLHGINCRPELGYNIGG